MNNDEIKTELDHILDILRDSELLHPELARLLHEIKYPIINLKDRI